jgi:para-nitrobenzyl esterase
MLRKLSLAVATITLAACGAKKEAEAPASPAPVADATIGEVVQTKSGAVRGTTVTELEKVTAFIYRGIPYAAPPVGELRWKAPQPVTAWTGERDATQWPNRCPQGSSSMGTGASISEDCLYLNVVTAAKTAGEKRPVIVFYHGGGLTSGTSSSTTYNHPMLPNKGVVLVSANSRLGPIGYLAHPELTKESGKGSSGNYGTLDLKASLEWVRDNIAAFGGDPGNVTIMGESGGGTKVISQMASPLTEGLFHKVIIESGSGLATSDRSLKFAEAEAAGVKLATALGAKEGPDVLKAMRAATWEQVLEAARKEGVGFRASPAVDGYVIPEPVHEQFKAGKQRKVPMIVGANQGEASLQTSVPQTADLHSKVAPTYVYNFTQLPLGWRKEKGCVAFHGLELTYVFGAIPIGLSSATTQGLARGGGCSTGLPAHDEQDLKVADQAATIWAQFAKTGNPSVAGLVDWPAYTAENKAFLLLGTPLEAKVGIEKSYIAPPPRAARAAGAN